MSLLSHDLGAPEEELLRVTEPEHGVIVLHIVLGKESVDLVDLHRQR